MPPFWLMIAEPLFTTPLLGLAKLIVVPATSAETTIDIFPPFRILKRV